MSSVASSLSMHICVCVIFSVLTILSSCYAIVLYAYLPCCHSITIIISLNCVQLTLPSQDQTVTSAFVLGTCVYALPSVYILPSLFCFSHLKNLKIAEDPGSSQSLEKKDRDGKPITNLDSIFKSRDITLPTKVCMVKAMFFSVVMYGCGI